MSRFILFIASVFAVAPSLASPSGKFESATCQLNQQRPVACQVKSRYTHRAAHMVTTIRWADGGITILTIPTARGQDTPYVDSDGGLWLGTWTNEGRIHTYVNISTNDVIKVSR